MIGSHMPSDSIFSAAFSSYGKQHQKCYLMKAEFMGLELVKPKPSS